MKTSEAEDEETEFVKSKDGQIYVCQRCKTQSKNDNNRTQFDIPSSIPQSLKNDLIMKCKYKDTIFSDASRFGSSTQQYDYIMLNRLESFLLKPIIPFIRVGHCPRGRYLQVKGNVILISADIQSTVEKILPQEQHLFPVSFKRKIIYEGYYLHEIIDKNKVVSYFEWLRRNNPHFFDIVLKEEEIDQFSFDMKSQAEEFENLSQPQMVEPEDEILKEEISEEVPLSSQYVSAMMNKYEGDNNDRSVTNHIADMIIEFEKDMGIADDEFQDEDDDQIPEEESSTIKGSNKGKICVAPGEYGKFVNWGESLYIEEKCFPNLFPYGESGYLSTCVKKEKKLSFANYVRNRMYSIDDRFRRDSYYISFLLLIKEKIEIKRSVQTYMRQCQRDSSLKTKSNFNQINKDDLKKTNKTYSVYKNIRGSAPYYEQVKKNVMATLRQKTYPTLFFTITSAEFNWDSLFHQILEHIFDRELTSEEVEKMNISKTERNKIMTENVVISTCFFEKRLKKILSYWKKHGFSRRNSAKQYFLLDFFYRIEFQARGAPHVHLFLWLIDQDGQPAPHLWDIELNIPPGFTKEEIVKTFHDDLISCSAFPKCDDHVDEDASEDGDCDECTALQNLVCKYQTHQCTFSCRKRKNIMKVRGTEGLGKFEEGPCEDLLVQLCRFRFPRYPMDDSIILYPMSAEEKKENSNSRKDLSHLKKYLARRTDNENSLKSFEKMNFWEFLFDLGFFPKGASSSDDMSFRQVAKEKYINAIRIDIKGSASFFMKRTNSELFLNNYCPSLLSVLNSNHDIQLVLDPYAAANYITGYLTKNESGVSNVLKQIEKSCKDLPKIETIKRFGTALDKHREVSIQEIIYRLLGFPMAKFSTKVKYLNTCHPDFRDGLLKANIEDLDDDEPIFHTSPHQYYEKRPYDMEDLCLAEFWANTEICRKNSKAATVQPLLDEKGFIYERQEPSVLRYYLNYEDPLELARALLILFFSFQK